MREVSLTVFFVLDREKVRKGRCGHRVSNMKDGRHGGEGGVAVAEQDDRGW